MAIKLTRGADANVRASIQRYFSEEVDDEIGDLKAQRLSDFVLSEIAPTTYNRTISDTDGIFKVRSQTSKGLATNRVLAPGRMHGSQTPDPTASTEKVLDVTGHPLIDVRERFYRYRHGASPAVANLT